jgi:hypothetical protein
MKRTRLLFPLAVPLLTANLFAGAFDLTGMNFADIAAAAKKEQPVVLAGGDAAPGPLTVELHINDVDASKGDVPAQGVLGEAGISVDNATPGTNVSIVSAGRLYEGAAVVPPAAGPNLLTQRGVNGPITFTLTFKKPVCRFSFTRPALIAGASGVSHPRWSVRAFDAKMNEAAVAAEELIRYFDDSKPSPERAFPLVAPEGSTGFTSIRISSDGDLYGRGSPGSAHFAGFSGVLMDSIQITYCR